MPIPSNSLGTSGIEGFAAQSSSASVELPAEHSPKRLL